MISFPIVLTSSQKEIHTFYFYGFTMHACSPRVGNVSDQKFSEASDNLFHIQDVSARDSKQNLPAHPFELAQRDEHNRTIRRRNPQYRLVFLWEGRSVTS